jgi:hypothetical protein
MWATMPQPTHQENYSLPPALKLYSSSTPNFEKHPDIPVASFATFFHGPLSGVEITCIQSFIDHGHEITIYCYRDYGAPPHFKTADASAILPESRVFFYKRGVGKGSVSAFSNLFRYTLLARLTGIWWVDSDVVCLSDQWPPHRDIGAAWEAAGIIGSAVLYCSPAIAGELAEQASQMGENITWGEAGPRLVTSCLRTKSLEGEILASSIFYPLPYASWRMSFDKRHLDEMERRCASAYTLHLWHEMLRRSRFNKNALPDPGSFFGRLVARHRTEQYFDDKERDEERPGVRSLLGSIQNWTKNHLGKSI